MSNPQRRFSYATLKTIAIAGALLTFLEPLLNAGAARQEVRMIAYGLLVIVLVVFHYFVGPPHRSTQPPAKGVFQGVGKIDTTKAWVRRNDSEPLLSALNRPAARTVFLVGSSGVGKSVL